MSDICGAREESVDATCGRSPHSVEHTPAGAWNHSRWHQDIRDGLLWAEWSSVVPEDDKGRLWPDGHVGPR